MAFFLPPRLALMVGLLVASDMLSKKKAVLYGPKMDTYAYAFY